MGEKIGRRREAERRPVYGDNGQAPALPGEFVERMEKLLGEDFPAFLECYQEEAVSGLRVNPLKGSDRDFLAKSGFSLEPVPWAEHGYYYGGGLHPGKHPFHAAGVYYIQEPSAMAAAGLLGALPGERVLDLCAAPGGKSTQLAAALEGRGLLVCNEIHPGRAKILSQNMERLGVRNGVVTNEPPERLAERFPGFFERVLVDAPCSGEGMFRKNVLARQEWSLENVLACARRQAEVLECGARALAPGGRLVYSTCTFSPEENEGTVFRFLERHREFHLAESTRAGVLSANGMPEWAGALLSEIRASGDFSDKTGMYRLWPHLLRGEGHFVAVLEKDESDGLKAPPLEKTVPSKKLPGEFREFAGENLAAEFPERFLLFGSRLYLLPEDTPELKGLRVLRPGLELGELKKNRFEPSHALALALKPGEGRRAVTLSLEDGAAGRYLNGETLPVQGEKGWNIVNVDGYSLGWGKVSGAQLKNHYPKGLRWA